jgi:hypothetical protein
MTNLWLDLAKSHGMNGSPMKQSRALVLVVLPATALIALGALGWWLLASENQLPPRSLAAPEPEPIAALPSQPAAVAAPTPEMLFASEFAKAPDEAAKLTLLDALPAKTWAKATDRVLADCMQRGESTAIRARAFDVALELTKRPQGDSKAAVLKVALDSHHADVRSRSLRECRIDPQPEMLEELLSAVRMGGTDRYLAVHALAALEDPRAQQSVLEAAKDESLPKPERARAIALLSRSKLPEAVDYLKELAAKQDAEFAGIATQALAAIQAAQTARK